MPRVKINIPDVFIFKTIIPIRITDINYGGHVGNHTVLSILHEARIQYLKYYGYTELDLNGISLIMRDVCIEFRKELFYGDQVIVSVSANEFSGVAFELYYKLETEFQSKNTIVATARTRMIGYDYANKKITAIPKPVKQALCN